jgi:hypothetical protein
MEMNLSKAGEEFVHQQVELILQRAYNEAVANVLSAVAEHVGVVTLDRVSVCKVEGSVAGTRSFAEGDRWPLEVRVVHTVCQKSR